VSLPSAFGCVAGGWLTPDLPIPRQPDVASADGIAQTELVAALRKPWRHSTNAFKALEWICARSLSTTGSPCTPPTPAKACTALARLLTRRVMPLKPFFNLIFETFALRSLSAAALLPFDIDYYCCAIGFIASSGERDLMSSF
jgi:hypothetical protein